MKYILCLHMYTLNNSRVIARVYDDDDTGPTMTRLTGNCESSKMEVKCQISLLHLNRTIIPHDFEHA